MKAACINAYGSDRVLELREFPDPRPGAHDVLVKIHAASVNPIDFKIRDGKLRILRSQQFPLILGHDCAGEIIQLGERVSKFKIGDRVFSRPRNGRIGTFAELIAIDQTEVALMPLNVTYEHAASIPLVGLTSWQALIDIAQLRRGQKILVQAGSGGIGTFAIQLAKHLGAEVWTTTSSKNFDFVKSLGADHVIDYHKSSVEDEVADVDVVFDTLGGEALTKSFSITKRGGWVVSISGRPDHRTAKDMGLGLWKTLLLGMVGLTSNLRADHADVNYRFLFMQSSGDELAQIAKLTNEGIIKPVVDKIFPFAECQAAIEYSSSGKARGKIVVSIAN